MISLGLWLIGAIWALFAIKWAFDIHSIKLLSTLNPCNPPHQVSVVIAARNECARIETTVRRLFAQREVHLQVIVVDDRSTDGTPEVLAQLRKDLPDLTVITVDVLPEDWIGKCHALHVGASEATADWVLFADADVWMSDDLVSRAVAQAVEDDTDHLCLLPSQREATIPGRAANIAFASTLIPTAADANRNRRFAYIGIGAFNLVRNDAYLASGGYERLRLEVCDDVKLGLLLKRAGKRTRVYFGGHDLEVDWAGSALGVVRAIEKNAFAILRFNVLFAGFVILAGLALWCSVFIGPFLEQPAGFVPLIGIGMTMLPARMMASRAQWGWAAVFLTPFTYPLLPWAILRSAWITIKQGGVTWRDTLYPLSVLRKGMVR